MFRQCTPPVGWPRNIGVATSGGPDSSCLLFLIHRYLSEEKSERTQRVFSLTVDHALQPTSAAMAEHCSKFAQRLGVEHVTSKIDWVQPPVSSEPFEAAARAARYQALFNSMTEKDIDTLAFGHHIDDQVETSLLRLSWGSTNLGAAGMKYCRRWGMGWLKDGLSEYGLEGMNRWIVRPLLDVSKDRILATCEANNLQYVVDQTNFQPGITLRNAIRHEIQANARNQPQTPMSMLPQDIVKRLMNLEIVARSLRNVSMSLDSSIEELRTGVRVLSQEARDIDDRVDSVLRSCSISTFPGTFLCSGMALHQVENYDVRRALVLRVLRYVSPNPWGSVNADAGRRRDAISQITKQLWTRMTKKSRIHSFNAGGGVLWSPVVVRGNEIKMPKIVISEFFSEGDMLGWIAYRAPPLHQRKLDQQGIANTLEIDVTKIIVDAYWRKGNGGPSTTSILYDCRFLLTFDLDKIPQDLISCLLNNPANNNRLVLLPRTRWFLPSVVIEQDGVAKMLHEKLSEEPKSSVFPIPKRQYRKRDGAEEIDSGWVMTQWVRPLTAI
ncbi:tRNA(Ile)-lysidine synthase [Termitomyces sp. J132]|nr:hypothetical protein C0989_011051 [Termitomyces sp. Mn162]KNZ79327.1 tRNA(Ile)-lysidine synthase [Termitomyces sp. J132]